MAFKCELCGKGPLTGNQVSHANNKTKKRTLPNLQRVHAMVGGRRTHLRVFNLEDPGQREAFLHSEAQMLPVPGSDRTVAYDPHKRIPVGVSRLGASRAVAIGAYAVAIDRLDRDRVS